MADKTAAASPGDPSADLRGTLIKRLAVAGMLVAVLLGVLAFFDYLAAPDEPEPTVYTQPVPVPPKKEMTQPVKPSATPPEAPKAEGEPEKPAAPPVADEPPPRPVVPAQPAAPETPSDAKPAPAARPAAPVVAPVPPPVPETTAAPKAAAPAGAAPAAPAAAKAGEAPAHPQPPTAPRLFAGYVLQAGVFANVQRAEELHAKLTLNGIPSTLEARVQVGPFKSKAEADAAREKLQSLGIDAVLVTPRGARR